MKKTRYDERSTIEMPGYKRAMELRTRHESARFARGFEPDLSRDLDIWHVGSLISESDEYLDRAIAEAECLSDVRGEEYIQECISSRIGQILSGSPPEPVVPTAIEQRHAQRIHEELLGMHPVRDDRQANAKLPKPHPKPVIVGDENEWLTPAQAAQERGVSLNTIYSWFKKGYLPQPWPGKTCIVQRGVLMRLEVPDARRRRRT